MLSVARGDNGPFEEFGLEIVACGDLCLGDLDRLIQDGVSRSIVDVDVVGKTRTDMSGSKSDGEGLEII